MTLWYSPKLQQWENDLSYSLSAQPFFQVGIVTDVDNDFQQP